MMFFQIRCQFWIDWPIHKKTQLHMGFKRLSSLYLQCLLCFGFSKFCMSLKILENFRYQLWLWKDYELQSSFERVIIFIHFLTFWVCLWAVTFGSLWLFYHSTCCKMELSTCIYFHFFMMERGVVVCVCVCVILTVIYYFY